MMMGRYYTWLLLWFGVVVFNRCRSSGNMIKGHYSFNKSKESHVQTIILGKLWLNGDTSPNKIMDASSINSEKGKI